MLSAAGEGSSEKSLLDPRRDHRRRGALPRRRRTGLSDEVLALLVCSTERIASPFMGGKGSRLMQNLMVQSNYKLES